MQCAPCLRRISAKHEYVHKINGLDCCYTYINRVVTWTASCLYRNREMWKKNGYFCWGWYILLKSVTYIILNISGFLLPHFGKSSVLHCFCFIYELWHEKKCALQPNSEKKRWIYLSLLSDVSFLMDKAWLIKWSLTRKSVIGPPGCLAWSMNLWKGTLFRETAHLCFKIV